MSAVDETARATTETAPSARRLAWSGSLWSVGGFGASQVLRMGSNIVLGHLLTTAAFGVMGWVNLVLSTLTMFSNFGLTQSIIQNKRGHEPAFLNTAWTILVVRGFVLWLIAVAVAWPVGRWAGFSPWYIVAAGMSAFISGARSTRYHLLQRQIDLKTLTVLDTLTQVLTVGLTILLAWILRNVWALIAAVLISSALNTALTHVMLKGERNRFQWDGGAAREMMSFGKWLFASTLLTFAALQADKVLLGSLVPLGLFGIYNVANSLAQLPLSVSSRLAQFVLYPLLARESRQDPAGLGPKVLKARHLMLAATLFATLGIVYYAPFFFRLYPETWAAAGWMTQLLSLSIWYTFLQTSCAQALLAVGDSRSLALSNAVKLPVTLVFAAAGYVAGGLWHSDAAAAAMAELVARPAAWGEPGALLGALAAIYPALTAEAFETERTVGFLLGLGVAGLATQAVVQYALVTHRIFIVRQDTLFTAALLALGAAGVLGMRALTADLSPTAADAVVFAADTAVLAALGLWVLWQVRRIMFRAGE
jgi:O-antigen/teichoic acid export membrane protein